MDLSELLNNPAFKKLSHPLEIKSTEEFEYALEMDAERIDEARKQGFTIICGDEHTVLLDLDTQEAYQHYLRMMEMIKNRYGLVKYEAWESKSGGGHMHVKLTIEESLTPIERVALQAILGSDPKRELLGMLKLKAGISMDPSVLFRPPSAIVVSQDFTEPTYTNET